MEKLGGEDGVGSELEAALGFYLELLSLGAGQGVPLGAHHSSNQGMLEEPLVQIHPSLGQFVFSGRAGWCTHSDRGSFGTGLDVGWVLSCQSGGV